MKNKNVLLITVLMGLAFLAYGNALFNTFVWDDKSFIVENSFIRNLQYISDLFHKPLSETSPVDRGFESYYRPFFLLSFMLDYHFWGLNSFFFHLHNVFLHMLCTILVFYFARILISDDFFAFCAALFFCFHPAHTEAVTAVFNRMDLLSSCFILGSFVAYAAFLKANTKVPVFLMVSLILFGAGLFAKETAVMLPVALFAYERCVLKKKISEILKMRWLYYLAFAVVFLFYLSFRISALAEFTLGYIRQPLYTSFTKTDLPFLSVYITLQSYWVYWTKLILPVNFNVIYFYDFTHPFQLEVFLSAVLIIVSIYAAVHCWKKNPAVSFLILWFYIFTFPVSQIIPFGNIVAEHYTYLPSIGFCGLLGFIFFEIKDKKLAARLPLFGSRAITLTIVGISAFYLYQTVLRNYDWRTELTLWSSSVKYKPLTSKPYVHLANTYFQLEEHQKAEKMYLFALSLNPYDAKAMTSLGALYVRQNEMQKGLDLMLIAIQNDPNDSFAYRNVGRTYNLMKDFTNAEKYLLKAKSLNPGRSELYYDLGLVYIHKGDFEKAENEFLHALSIDSSDPYGYYGLGLAYFHRGQKKEADKFFQKAVGLEPRLQKTLEKLLESEGAER